MALMIESPKAWDANTEWRDEAACRDLDPNLFFVVGVTGPAIPQLAKAKSVCRMCPVQAACLEFAITTNQEFGVWGGTSEEERRALRRQWRSRQRQARQVAAS